MYELREGSWGPSEAQRFCEVVDNRTGKVVATFTGGYFDGVHFIARKRAELWVEKQNVRRAELKWFCGLMEEKLRENDHKKHWRDLDIHYLIRRLYQELNELEVAIDDGGDPEKVALEAADVANFAMMIADHYKGRHTVPRTPRVKISGRTNEEMDD